MGTLMKCPSRVPPTLPPSCPHTAVPLTGDPVCVLGFRPAGETQLQPADGHAGEAAEAEPAALPSRALLEVG